MKAFVGAVKEGSAMPIDFDCLLDTTLATLGVAESLKTGNTIHLDSLWT